MERDKANEFNRFYLPQFLRPTHSIWYGVNVDPRLTQFDLLPFLKAVERRPDGSERRICIDGKQRLTSIHRCVIMSTHVFFTYDSFFLPIKGFQREM